jgi:tripartite-type tricarboxylate transporter receptor subunit TctC
MVVNPAVPAKTVPEFIAYAKANPRKVNMASNGNGGLLHLAGELFKMMTGVDLVHVPYRGAQPALTDLISGQVQVMFVASTVEYIKTGKVRALAPPPPTRSEVLPDVPPLSEFVPGYDAAAWIGVGAPKNTPPEIIDKLNKEVNAALADPKLKLRLGSARPTSRRNEASLHRHFREGCYETSPPKFSASGRGCCRAAVRVTDCTGARPSIKAGPYHRRLHGGQRYRHHGPPVCAKTQ